MFKSHHDTFSRHSQPGLQPEDSAQRTFGLSPQRLHRALEVVRSSSRQSRKDDRAGKFKFQDPLSNGQMLTDIEGSNHDYDVTFDN